MSRCESWILATRTVRGLRRKRLVNRVEERGDRHGEFQLGSSRCFSQQLELPSSPGPTVEHTSRLLRRTEIILSKTLRPGTQSLKLWNGVLKSAHDRLLAGHGVKRHVVVYGVEKHSAAEDLVTILLEDPLSSDDEHHTRIRDRWKGVGEEPIEFEYDRRYSRRGRCFRIAAPRLEQLSINLTELPIGFAATHIDILFGADIPIIVVNPLVTSIPDLENLLPPNPHLILVVNSTVGFSTAQYIRAEVRRRLNGRTVRVFFVDIEKALRSLDILRTSSTSAAAIQTYQSDFLASQMSSLLSELQKILKSDEEAGRIRSTLSLLRQPVAMSRISLHEAFQELNAVHSITTGLRSRILEDEGKAMREILGGGENSVVRTAVEKAGKDVKVTMDALTWWKLPLKVDELSRIVSRAVEASTFRDFESQLVLHTGRLTSLQATILEMTNAHMASLPSALDSAVLRNALAQLRASPAYSLSTSSLTGPLYARHAQLAHATNHLHLAGQQAVLGTSFVAFSSVAGAYWAWMSAFLDGATVYAAGALGAMIALRWAVGKWEKAKMRWWQDWDRVGEGLERDLRKVLQDTLQRQVMLVPEKACVELELLAEKRAQELQDLKEATQELEHDIDSMIHKS